MSDKVATIPIDKEYEKHANINREDIQKLREWLKTQPHLPEKYITDLDLILVYHCCEHSVQVSKQLLDLHFTSKTLLTNFFADRKVDQHIEEAYKSALFLGIDEVGKDGTRFMYSRLNPVDVKHFHLIACCRAFLMVLDLWQYEDGTWPGFSIILDMDHCTWGHIAKLDLMTLRQAIYFVQDCLLVKMKNIYFINALPMVDRIITLIRPIMKKELFDKIIIQRVGSDINKLDIPVKSIPANDVQNLVKLGDQMVKRLKDNKDYFEEDNLKRVNESLRPGGKTTIEDVFGIQGSFKKLDID